MNEYPSTFDYAHGTANPVLTLLQGARKRYRLHGTDVAYVGPTGTVCAIGAVAREAGVTYDKYADLDAEGYSLTEEFEKALEYEGIEAAAIATAKDAIARLDAAAGRLFADELPSDSDYGNWSGPLEWLNQETEDFSERVLACYDEAIKWAHQR